MGVYINMKMPDKCGHCRFATAFDCGVDGQFIPTHDARRKDCPLAEVPEPHGRLGDLDALEQDAQKRLLMCNKNDNQFQKPYEIMRAIALAPTIIPASEEV